jgi:hypothetical protein
MQRVGGDCEYPRARLWLLVLIKLDWNKALSRRLEADDFDLFSVLQA